MRARRWALYGALLLPAFFLWCPWLAPVLAALWWAAFALVYRPARPHWNAGTSRFRAVPGRCFSAALCAAGVSALCLALVIHLNFLPLIALAAPLGQGAGALAFRHGRAALWQSFERSRFHVPSRRSRIHRAQNL